MEKSPQYGDWAHTEKSANREDYNQLNILTGGEEGGHNKTKQSKAKHAAYIPPHSASNTLQAVYKLIMQATHCPPSKLGTHFTDLGRMEG